MDIIGLLFCCYCYWAYTVSGFLPFLLGNRKFMLSTLLVSTISGVREIHIHTQRLFNVQLAYLKLVMLLGFSCWSDDGEWWEVTWHNFWLYICVELTYKLLFGQKSVETTIAKSNKQKRLKPKPDKKRIYSLSSILPSSSASSSSLKIPSQKK